MKLEKAKLRGEVSEGMLCSARELGLGQEHDGILELATDAAPGTPLPRGAPAGRLSARGGRDAQPPRPARPQGRRARALRVATARRSGCRRFPGAAGIDVPPGAPGGADGPVGGAPRRHRGRRVLPPVPCAPSSAARRSAPRRSGSRRRLEAVGVRSINNVVDATNYVMLELNQPMHAYDLARLRGGALVVRRARGRRAAGDAGRRRAPAHAPTWWRSPTPRA